LAVPIAGPVGPGESSLEQAATATKQIVVSSCTVFRVATG